MRISPRTCAPARQSLFNLLILGFGPLASNFLSGFLLDVFTKGNKIEYHQVFLVPLGLGLLAAAILAIFFHPEKKEPVPEEVPVLVH